MLLTRRLAQPAPVTVITVVFLPELEGFWRDGLEVLRRCLGSLRSTTPQPFELVVMDNGSCAGVRTYLGELFENRDIDQLLLSRRNLGKVGAWNLLFAAAQGEIVSYVDSDIYFLPGWFEATQQVLDAYPEAGVVTAQAMSRDLRHYCGSTLRGAAADPSVECDEGPGLVPREYVEAHLTGLGESRESYEQRIPTRHDVRLCRGDRQAFAGSAHFQFSGRREALVELFPLASSRAMGDVNVLDEAIDDAGLWRLSTTGYYVHHMGNRVPDLEVELPWVQQELSTTARGPGRADADRSRKSLSRQFWDRLGLSERYRVRQLLKRLNRWSHELLYPD